MAAGFNKVILMGNLTRDPELRYTPQGTAVADLGLAVNTVRGGRGTEKKEDTLFIDVTVWDKTAEICSEYLTKGRQVLIEGRMVQDEWEDRDSGQKRRKIKVVAQNVQFVGGSGSSSSGSQRTTAPSSRPSPKEEPPLDDFSGGDDIPF
jgi:single-strand DNA-binding protein